MHSSATQQRCDSALKRRTSLVDLCYHHGCSEILHTNKELAFIHVGHCENLRRVSPQISFFVSPGFKITGAS